MKKYKPIIFLVLITLLYIYLIPEEDYFPLEDIDIPIGIGLDCADDNNFRINAEVYSVEGEKTIASILHFGEGPNFTRTREDRQSKSNQIIVIALSRVVLIDEELARKGIHPFFNVLFTDVNVNDKSLVAVAKQKCKDIFTMKMEGSNVPSSFIEDLLLVNKTQNFLKDNFKLLDMYVREEGEGKNIVVPYIEKKGNNIEITGMAIFNKDTLVNIIDLKESKIMNILRENNASGLLNIQFSRDKFIDFHCKNKRKVICKKINDDKYEFTIDILLEGGILNNNALYNFNDDINVSEGYKQMLKKSVEDECNNFISKMQNEYKMDLLQLGAVAAAKYGRGTGKDWNKVICDSKINVDVNIKINSLGKGQY